jgi:hypothetical protein
MDANAAGDGADFVTGLGSKPLVGSKSALTVALSPVPFVAAGILRLTRALLGGDRVVRP